MKEYFVKKSKHTIEPEEILLDPVAAGRADPYERLEFAVSPRWGSFFLVIFVGAAVLLGGVTLYYQTIRGGALYAEAEENRIRLLFEEAPRGVIVDWSGKVLAENQMTFDVLVFSLDLPKEEAALKRHAEMVGRYLGTTPGFILETLLQIQRKNRAEPTVLAGDILRESALALKAREGELTGIKVVGKYQRYYPRGAVFSHVIGYTGRVAASEIKANPEFLPKDVVGRQGLEAEWDEVLRGRRGETRYEVDARLSKLEEREKVSSAPGRKLELTIDASLQEVFYNAMRTQMVQSGLERGAGVALDPRTGEVRAFVSLPGFDNNLFARGISQEAFSSLANSRSKPLFNRVVSGEYSPGSTLKPFVAAAALQEGVVTPDTKILDDEGRIVVPNPYDPTKPTIFRDWKVHGWMDVREALADSCNVYFYAVGGGYQNIKGLGIERIKKYLEEFGFGSVLGIDLGGERGGLLPDPAWKAAVRKSDPIWRIGDTYLTSIGQGDVGATPIQLAVATAALANGGKIYAPYLVKRVVGEEITEQEFSSRLIRQVSVDQKWLEVVREGMRRAVTGGTASALSALPFSVAGKTGTAQVLSNTQTNAFFISFAPYENPEIVVVVVMENGQGGITNAVPVAKEVLSWWWASRGLSD
ncbi:MAG: penicillin-binding protein 2 [Parcubacteria group bacterium]|nr:penicillin-binding protein 2 [Parcubacteria group bacterium]